MISRNPPIRVDADGHELRDVGVKAFPCEAYVVDPLTNPIPWHLHHSFEFVIALEGSFACGVAGAQWTLPAGNAVMVNTMSPHGFFAAEGRPATFGSLVCHRDFLFGPEGSVFWNRCFSLLGAPDGPSALELCQNGEQWERDAIALLRQAHEAMTTEEGLFQETVRHALTQVVYLVEQNAHLGIAREAPIGRDSSGPFCSMAAFVEEHFSEPLSVQRIAEAGAVSVREAQRVFRATVGRTPVDYLTDFRLYEAARLLCETNLPVALVAERCGFSTPAYFSARFRERYGHTPREHREALAPAREGEAHAS